MSLLQSYIILTGDTIHDCNIGRFESADKMIKLVFDFKEFESIGMFSLGSKINDSLTKDVSSSR